MEEETSPIASNQTDSMNEETSPTAMNQTTASMEEFPLAVENSISRSMHDVGVQTDQICLRFFEDDRKSRFFTGLSTYAHLQSLYGQIEKDLPMSMTLTKFQIFYITMVRLRLDLSFTYLAYQFKVHHSTISKYFHACLFVLYSRLRSLIYWPERSTIKYTMPEVFQRSFQDQIVIIIDCFEVFIEQSSVLKTSSATWSNYKHSHTVKYLIGITPQGNFIRLLKMQKLS